MVEKKILIDEEKQRKTKRRSNKRLTISHEEKDNPMLKDLSSEWQMFYQGVIRQINGK